MATRHVKGYGVQVTGIPELQRALKATDDGLRKEVRNAFKDIARHVIGKAGDRGAPRSILKPTVSMKGAGISFPRGGPGSRVDPVGFYPWLDFGGGRKAGRGVTPSGERRDKTRDGRYLYPAIGSSTEYIGDAVGDVIEKVAERQGLEVRR